MVRGAQESRLSRSGRGRGGTCCRLFIIRRLARGVVGLSPYRRALGACPRRSAGPRRRRAPRRGVISARLDDEYACDDRRDRCGQPELAAFSREARVPSRRSLQGGRPQVRPVARSRLHAEVPRRARRLALTKDASYRVVGRGKAEAPSRPAQEAGGEEVCGLTPIKWQIAKTRSARFIV